MECEEKTHTEVCFRHFMFWGKINVKLSLYLIKRHAMRAYWGLVFLRSALDGVS